MKRTLKCLTLLSLFISFFPLQAEDSDQASRKEARKARRAERQARREQNKEENTD